MAAPIRKQETDNVITLQIIDGKLGVKPKVRYNKDGSIDKRHPNKVAGTSSTVYPFDMDEIKAMIDVFNKRIENASNEDKRQIALRNKTLFLVSINVGLRASDLLKLRYNYFYNDDMSFKEYYELIPKKQNSSRKFVKIFFNKTVKKALNNYIEQYPIMDLNDFVFKSRKGEGAITERAFWKIIVDAAEEANISKNVGSHSCRKTWARQIYDNAENKSNALVMLQECLKHSSSMTTLRYIAIMDEEKKDMYESIELGLDFI